MVRFYCILQNPNNFKTSETEGLYICLQLFLQIFKDEECVKAKKKDLYSFVKDGCGMEVQSRRTCVRGTVKDFVREITAIWSKIG